MQNDINPPYSSGDRPKIAPEEDPLNVSEFSKSKEPDDTVEVPDNKPSKKGSKLNLGKMVGFRHWKQLNKKQRLASLVIIGLLVIGGTLGAMELLIKDPGEPSSPQIASSKPEPTTAPSPLTGVEVAIDLSTLPVTGVMIENSPDARPQSGLQEAGVVFEAIAEGGITRFMALFQEAQPSNIGPVRSVRPYYLDFLVPFDAPIAHAGGSAVALAQIRSQNIKDLDHGLNAQAYRRVSSRYAPHNLYTTRENLLKVHKAKGWTKSNFKGFERKKAEPADTPTATTISVNISSANYNSSYTYDKKTNTYKRKMAGLPHKDEGTGKQISPSVLIILVADHSYSGIYSVYQNKGKGTALVFQDGKVTKGVWNKKDRKTQLTFATSDGSVLKLNPGQTWVTLADNAGQIKYSAPSE